MIEENNKAETSSNESGMLYASGLLFLISGGILTILLAILIYDMIWGWRMMLNPCCICVPYPYHYRGINVGMLVKDIIGSASFLIWIITAIICGIIGMRNYKRPQSARRCLKRGVVAIIIHMAVMVVFLFIGPTMNIIGAILLPIYVLQIVGAHRFKERLAFD